MSPLGLAANFLGWPVIQIIVSWVAFKRDRRSFNPNGFLYRERGVERSGVFYRRLFQVTTWKNILPDGAKIFPGTFKKSSKLQRSEPFLSQFLTETCRGEWAHWTMMAFTPVFFLWNPPWACWVMLAYGALTNLPCIIVQRHNRQVLRRTLGRISASVCDD